MKKNGFTLIELLVVIAIIAILAAILFPVFAKAREKARQTTCLSNMKQVCLAYTQYMQDFDETAPLHDYNWGVMWFWKPNPYEYLWSPNWVWCLEPYTKTNKVFSCPSCIDNLGLAGSAAFRSDFAANEYVLTWLGNHGVYAVIPTTLAEITKPSNTIFIQDYNGYGYSPDYPVALVSPGINFTIPANATNNYKEFIGYDPKDPDPKLASKTGAVHNGGKNIGYVDGHCKWLAYNALRSQITKWQPGADPVADNPFCKKQP